MLAKSEWKPEEDSLSYEPITDIISTPNREQKWVHVTLSDGKVIKATEGHPFRTAEGWRDAVLLRKGDTLILNGSDGKPSTIQVDGIRYETKVLTTYNLEVANAHTFFVGEDAVLVHNDITCGRSKKIRLRKLIEDIKSRKKRGEEFTEFKNKDNKLPKYNKDGTPAKYTEHDYQKPPTPEQRANGADRGKKRVVISNDGTSYYTNDHYDSFERVKY